MNNLLILYELNKAPSTMYGIANSIKSDFAVLLTPSIGTIKPALKRLESSGFISSQKLMTSGGRPSVCYAITEQGKVALKYEMLSDLPENPIQFLVNARVRLYCAEVLDNEDFMNLLAELKLRTENLMLDTQEMVLNNDVTFYPKMVFDNLTCEYKNFYSLLEGIEHACKR